MPVQVPEHMPLQVAPAVNPHEINGTGTTSNLPVNLKRPLVSSFFSPRPGSGAAGVGQLDNAACLRLTGRLPVRALTCRLSTVTGRSAALQCHCQWHGIQVQVEIEVALQRELVGEFKLVMRLGGGIIRGKP